MPFLALYWKYIAAAVLVAAYTGFVYHAGGNAPREELATIKAASIAYKTESARIAKEKNDEYTKSLADAKSAWDAYRLRKPAVKTVRVTTNVCSNETGNTIVSDAVSAYVASVGQFRNQVEGLLADCDAQRQQLSCAVIWAGTINR